jgi:glycosyltransferase involved in cell wall biosynthesis
VSFFLNFFFWTIKFFKLKKKGLTDQENYSPNAFNLIGPYPKSLILWLKKSYLEKEKREQLYEIRGYKNHIIYFFEKIDILEVNKNLCILEFPLSISGIYKYYKFIINLEPKLIQMHDPKSAVISTLFFKDFFKAKSFCITRGSTFHEDFIFRPKNGILDFFRSFFSNILLSISLKNLDFIFSSPSVAIETEVSIKKRVLRTNVVWCEAIFNIDNNLLSKISKVHFLLPKKDRKNYLIFSRIENKKIENLIDVFVKSDLDAHLYIIGTGSELESLKKKHNNADSIHFMGWMEKKNAHLKILEMDLHLTRLAGFSTIECGLLGVPTVCPNIIMHSDIIENNYDGFLYNLNYDSHLSSILKKFNAMSSEDLLLLKKNVIKSFTRKFNKNNYILEKEKIFETIKSNQ